MVFLHGELRDSVDISKVIAVEQFSYILIFLIYIIRV